MSVTAYDWRKVVEETKIGDLVKAGDSVNFLDMARSLSKSSVWSIRYESLSTLGPPTGGELRFLGGTGGGATVEAQAQIQLGITTVAPSAIFELFPNSGEDGLQVVLRAAYKQVLGNTYVMESEKPTDSESLLRNGSISVREFVRRLTKSDLYKSRFFHSTSNNRFIELNFKHLLGRAPYDQGEIQEHFSRYHKSGYEVEVDSYIDSDEYRTVFGENIVPYFRGFKYQSTQSAAAFPRLLKLYQGDAGSDTDRNRSGQRTRVETGDLNVSGRFSKPL